MRTRLLLVLMTVGVLVAGLSVGCSPAGSSGTGDHDGAQGEKIVWTLDTYFPPPPGIYISRSVQSFVDRVNARLDGRFEINPSYGSSLGVPGPEVAVALSQGVFECGYTALSYLAGDIPVLGISGLPSLIANPGEGFTAHTVLTKYYNSELESRGVKLIGNPWYFPKQAIWSKTPIRTVSDFKGMRFRVSTPEQTMMIDALGAIPVSLNMPEVYQALERGMLDAILGSTATAMSVSAWEVLDYGIDVSFCAGDSGFLVSKSAWEALPAAVKVVLLEEAQLTSNEMNRQSITEEDNDWVTLSSRGLDRMTPEESFTGDMAQIAAPIWDSWAATRSGAPTEALGETRAILGK